MSKNDTLLCNCAVLLQLLLSYSSGCVYYRTSCSHMLWKSQQNYFFHPKIVFLLIMQCPVRRKIKTFYSV